MANDVSMLLAADRGALIANRHLDTQSLLPGDHRVFFRVARGGQLVRRVSGFPRSLIRLILFLICVRTPSHVDFSKRQCFDIAQYRRSVEDLEAELANFAASRPIGLVLPSLYSELEGPALENIVNELAKVPYLSRITIGLDRADKDQFNHAKIFSRLPQNHDVLWHDGPRLTAL